MPITETISLLTSECFSGPMMGMPPPTDASNMMSTPAFDAASMTSWPLLAMSALFAVTTDLPACSAESTTTFAAFVPPISSMTMSTRSSAMTWAASVVNIDSGRPRAVAREASRSATFTSSMSTPARREKSSRCARSISTTPEPTVPSPTRPTPMVRMLPSLRVRRGLHPALSQGLYEQGDAARRTPRALVSIPLALATAGLVAAFASSAVASTPTPTTTDTVAPVTTSDATATYAGTAMIHLTATDNAGGSGVSSTYFVLDGAPQVSGTAVLANTVGTHTLAFWSVDAAGNTEAQNTVTFAVTAALPIPGTK